MINFKKLDVLRFKHNVSSYPMCNKPMKIVSKSIVIYNYNERTSGLDTAENYISNYMFVKKI